MLARQGSRSTQSLAKRLSKQLGVSGVGVRVTPQNGRTKPLTDQAHRDGCSVGSVSLAVQHCDELTNSLDKLRTRRMCPEGASNNPLQWHSAPLHEGLDGQRITRTITTSDLLNLLCEIHDFCS
jgi:hypothetical protein